jgi:hypothetical protein
MSEVELFLFTIQLANTHTFHPCTLVGLMQSDYNKSTGIGEEESDTYRPIFCTGQT